MPVVSAIIPKLYENWHINHILQSFNTALHKTSEQAMPQTGELNDIAFASHEDQRSITAQKSVQFGNNWKLYTK